MRRTTKGVMDAMKQERAKDWVKVVVQTTDEPSRPPIDTRRFQSIPEPARPLSPRKGSLESAKSARPVMSTEEAQREFQRLLELYGDPDDDAALIAKRDRAFADLFVRSGWTQVQWATELGKSQGWVQKHLLFGRFLNFLDDNPTGLSLDGLTERRFRGYWGRISAAGDESVSFAEVVRLMQAPPEPKPIQPSSRPAAVAEPAATDYVVEDTIPRLSLSDQEKFDALVEAKVQQRLDQYVEDYILPEYAAKLAKAELLMKGSKPFTNKEFTSVLLRALHPDTSNAENRHAAFLLLKEREVMLRPDEKDRPLTSGLPRTVAELRAGKRKH